ncbi:hypothetical protein CDV31_014552 [Fusarium ambrosium]|uniref:LITAF domain-containing protein n=1 Tax=Fusarium ambrosium TaxID=131363 RepID=A0A428SVE2_9HYPO|nr:hypothetical protein CDV31_014552 [Fusarium ambrosium]
MHLLSFFGQCAVLGLLRAALAAPGQVDCPGGGVEIVEIQPYEIVCDGKTSMSTGTRTYTKHPGSTVVPAPDHPGQPYRPGGLISPGPPGNTPSNPGQPYTPENPNEPPPCENCVKVTTTVATPFCTTIPPDTVGGVRTVVTGVPLPCEDCVTITTSGSTPRITTLVPALTGGKTTCYDDDSYIELHWHVELHSNDYSARV